VLLTVGQGCRSVCTCSQLFDREVWCGVVWRGVVMWWCGVVSTASECALVCKGSELRLT
jgi:hypothetical protein